jgi:predicted Rossmann fold nucleotide-binding protein DprA/Smf involved in DNA uptake
MKRKIKTIKLGITGTRFFNNYVLIKNELNKLYPNTQMIEVLVSGHARGVDTLCEQWAKEYKIPIDSHPPDWDTYGKGAAFIRNKEIVNISDELVGFPLDSSSEHYPSKGTINTINEAKKQGKKIIIIPVKET